MAEQREKLLKRKRILLVEDSPTQALEVKLALEEKGFVVEIAENGQLGLDRALKEKFDLILLDHHLPVLEGLEIVGCLNNQKVKTPVIMITGSPDARVAEIMISAGVVDYVVKDENYATTLPVTVERVLEKHRP